ncbi:MAG: T9SS type A sorting domain-containing protein, partial [Ignavibacteria bacterium]
SGKNRRASLYLGNTNEITSGYDLPPVPPAGIFDVRFGTEKFAEAIGHNHTIKLSGNTEETRLTFRNMKGMSFRLRDAIDGTILNKTITEGTEIVIPANMNSLILETMSIVPQTYELEQNYPNPFNPSTMIKYQTANDGLVKLAVYDMLGREVKTLVNNFQPAGTYDIVLDASELTSGVYFYRLTSGSFEEMRKMIVVK